MNLDLLQTRFAARRRQLNSQIIGKVAAGQGRGIVKDLVESSFSNEFSAFLPCARPTVEVAIRSPDNVRIVFDHEDGISQVTQIMQYLNKAVRIPAVQTDRRLIEHVQRPHQS